MYLRTTSRYNKDGSKVTYYQLAETVYNSEKKRPEAKVIHNFGRADSLDIESLKRLASSILRVCDEPDFQGGAVGPRKDIELLESYSYGPIHVLDGLWEQMGIGEILRRRMKKIGSRAPHERILLAMTANRLQAPCSKLACYEHWMNEEVYLPDARGWKLDQLYRALDFLLDGIEDIEREVFYRVADLFNADVDLVFFDTTTMWCEVDEEDETESTWRGRGFNPLRKRGHNKEGMDGKPQVVVGLALTRDGLPVRSWVFPGNTVDVTTVSRIREDLQGWRLGRCVLVGDAGMYSAENLKTLSKGLGRYILAVPMRKVKEVKADVLQRAGRYREVKPGLEVKEVVVGTGERRRRYLVCRNLDEAKREKLHREQLIEILEQELRAIERSADDHPKHSCELMASKRFGRYLKRNPGGRLAIDQEKIKAEEKFDGKYVLTTNDDSLTPEDMALGYKSMMIIEGCFRRMKTAGLRTRPMFHWTAHRIVAHVKLCVLALLLQRAAEIRCEDTWRNIHLALRRIQVIEYRSQGKSILQTTKVSQKTQAILKKLGISTPKKILSITTVS